MHTYVFVLVCEEEAWVTGHLGMRREGVGHRSSCYKRRRGGSPVVLVCEEAEYHRNPGNRGEQCKAKQSKAMQGKM